MIEHNATNAIRTYWEREHNTSAATAILSTTDRGAYRTVLRHIPGVTADPVSSTPTAREVIESLAAVSDILGDALRERTRVEEELRALRSDVDAARRIFGGTLTPKP